MVEHGARRRPESTDTPSLIALALCAAISLAVACPVALGVGPVGAQGRELTPIDSIKYADSLAKAESLHVNDSLATADSIEAVAELSNSGNSFGGARSILDRQRMGQPIIYNTTYSVNRTNTNWSQNMDIMVTHGNLQIGNVTSASFGRETKIGRLNKNRQTQTEFAYKVSSQLRLGAHVALTRISDEARLRGNFTGTKQDVDDIAGQARYAKNFGQFPVHVVGSYGYLKSGQFDQASKGSSFNIFGSTSRAWGDRASVSFDASDQISRLQSSVASDPGFLEDDRNANTSLHLTSNAKINRWLSAEGHVSSQHSVLRRPAQIPPDPTKPDSTITAHERIDGVNDDGGAGLHFILPKAGSLNLSGTVSKNRQVYVAQTDRSSITDRKDFTIDAHKSLLKTGLNLTYDESVDNNDNTRRDPGYIQSSLNRRLEGDAARPLSRNTTARLNLGIYLTRQSYTDFRSAIAGAVAPSDQDQLRARGTINLQYKPVNRYSTGLQLGYEQNDQVNLSASSSINNARLRTYTVQWNWDASPGSTWNMNQTNSASAAQQFYTFSSDRDQLSFIYTFNTLITNQISPKVRLDLTHIVRLQSRGSFRKDGDVRRFGKTSDFNTLDLTLREQYQPTSVATFEVSERLAVNPSFNYTRGVSHKISETRRDELNFIGRLNYPFNNRANLSGDIRRILATDRAHTFGPEGTQTSTNSDYWLVTLSFHMEF
jgi:hypothetical protein